MTVAGVKWLSGVGLAWNRPGFRDFRRYVLLPYAVQRALLVTAVTIASAVHELPRVDRAMPALRPIDNWLRWDALHYLHVAADGYGPAAAAPQNGFFPLFPALVGVLDHVVPLGVAALLVSNLCATAALELLRRLAHCYGDDAFARRVVWVAILYPTSFYLTAGYSESTFLVVTIGAALAWKTDRWGWAFVAAALAVLARPVGAACVTVPFAVGWLVRRRGLATVAALCAGAAVGLAALLAVYRAQTGDPLAFLHATGVQNLRVFWTDGADSPNLIALLVDEGFGRNLMQRLLNWSSVSLAFACAIALAWQRRGELALLCVVALAIPLYFHHSFVDMASMSRYALAAFPMFLVLAGWFPADAPRSRYYDLGSQMLQVGLAVAFASARWLE